MDNVKIICVFGDSVAFGAWDRQLGGWVNRLRLYFESLHEGDSSPALIYNLGIETNTTNDLLTRFENEARERFWEESKVDRKDLNVCIFEIGKNDSLYTGTKDKPWVSATEYALNLAELIRKARMHSSYIFFLGLAHVNESETIPWDDDGRSYDNENIEQYDAVIQRVCQEKDVHYIRIMDVLDLHELEDGVHPNSAGHEKIFIKVRDSLVEKVIV